MGEQLEYRIFRSSLLRLAAAKVETSFCWVGINQTVADRLQRVFADLNQVTLKTHSGANSNKRFFCFVLEYKNLRREEFSGQLVEAFGGSMLLTTVQYFSEGSCWGSGSTCDI